MGWIIAQIKWVCHYKFCRTVDGAAASSIIYSLVETEKANNLSVFQYIYTLLLYMPGYKYRLEGNKRFSVLDKTYFLYYR